ncbi:hypothetical protein PIB30_078895 [Stylosanthes scabra]|uniref:Uncharacterized protein n=1 Tax=Stylosanthes scabra TaxID=79078 RepID=A0ABU6SR43_9FABA|nr:hypothetical protein [Stylosanthes scabra]
MAQKPHLQLKELGSKLESLPSDDDSLLTLLEQAAGCLTELDQSPSASKLELMKPFFNAIVKPELLKHEDRNAKLLVATCLCEITRITAPEAPYSDDVLKDIFQLIVSTFSGLSDTDSPSFGRRVAMLETLAKYRSCVVMLDLECDDLVNEMFRTFFAVARDDHPESVLSSMQMIMVVLLEESEDIHEDLLSILLSTLGHERGDVTDAARKLAVNVIQQCVEKLEPSVKQFLLPLMSGDSKLVDNQVQYHAVIYDLYCCAPETLSGVLPYITGELMTDELETRLKAVNMVGNIIALPGSPIPETFQPTFSEFLKRLTDRDFGVRMSVVDHLKSSLLSNPFRAEAPEIFSSLCDRLLDVDESFRKQVVAVICDVACHAPNAVPLETVKLVAERLRDKSFALLFIKFVSLVRSLLYLVNNLHVANLPCYNLLLKLGSDVIESVLSGSLFPSEFSTNDVVKRWFDIFSGFDKLEVRALEKILEQKQRLQQEMQKYLAMRQTSQDKDNPEVQKKIAFCFRVMSRSFSDPAKAEENFQILDQLEDENIWKILTNLVDPNASYHQTRVYQEDLLKLLGEKHQLYEFLDTLYVQCSYLLFNKEHVKAILSEIVKHKSAENDQRIKSCMNMLVIIARFSPVLFSGSEEELVNLLKDNNDVIKEGVSNVLAKAGGTIREQLAVTSSSVDLMLERLCLEGNRRQAKYAVHALAAITRDDGLKALSVLYKRLVDMLEEKTHLPAVLQSLGCIAQTAMPVFETRESEIEEFIINKILKQDSKEDHARNSWDDTSDLCMLKIYGIKTIVKGYLPVKDAHVRSAHLKLAAAKAVLRLSRLWDHKIPVDIFHLTLRVSEISFPQARSIFLSKVHQYIKDHLLDAKYACAFVFNIFESKPEEFSEDKLNLADIIQMLQQAKARQLSVQSDANPLTTYPEYILPFLVHALASISCPNVDECKDVESYDSIYRQLHLVLSILVQIDEDVKSESTTNGEKEIISTITSIFQNIKHSEDVVNASKSKNSHAISELGLAITKRLAQKKNVDLQGSSPSVSLPSTLYKMREKEDDTVSEVRTWLADESALTHFESLEFEMVPSQSAEGNGLKDNEKDGNDMPLGKIMKNIKSKGTKVKKVNKKKSVPAETKKTENDIDILNMVREINLDNLGISTNFESSNGHEHSLSKKEQNDPEFAAKKRKVEEASSVPVPKRRRTSLTHGKLRPSSTSKASQFFSGVESSRVKSPLEAKPSLDTDSKAPQRKMIKSSERTVKPKAKGSKSYNNDKANKFDENDEEIPDDSKRTDKAENDNLKSSIGSPKKLKRKSIGGLTKCTTKEDDSEAEDLIGCRIKVWWPMDKEFYEGTIKSYDPSKGKHVILYEDGDVEVLRLEKERWELVDKGRKSTKKMKPSKPLSTPEASSGKKQRSSSVSASRKTKKISNGKHVKRGQKGTSQSNLRDEDAKESSEISSPEETNISKAEENSDASDGEQAEGSESDQIKKNKSDKKVKSAPQGKRPKKGKSSSKRDKLDEEKPESDEETHDHSERHSEDRETAPQGAENDEESSLKKRDVDKSSGDPREKDNGEAESGSEGNQNDNDEESSPKEGNQNDNEEESNPKSTEKSHMESTTHSTENAEVADDEPLSKWKQPSGRKSSSKKSSVKKR